VPQTSESYAVKECNNWLVPVTITLFSPAQLDEIRNTFALCVGFF